jgi:hypothetical protein
MKREGKLTHQEVSPTAASATNRLYGPSGEISYRCTLVTAMGGVIPVDVNAATGDEAAERALAKFPGSKVSHVAPAPQEAEAE